MTATALAAVGSNANENGTLLISGTAVTASGTSVDFTGIPSYAKRVTVMFGGVSTNGTSVVQIQLGTSSGIEATAYNGTTWQSNTANIALSTGFTVGSTNAAIIQIHGILQLALIGSNTWAASGNLGRASGVDFCLIGGSKALSGTLDRVRITTVNGTDAFDAGTINIMWE